MEKLMVWIMGFIKELAKEFGAEFLVDATRGGNSDAGASLGKALAHRAKKPGEYRHELMTFINSELKEVDPVAAENFFRRWEEREQNQKRSYYVGRSKPPYEPGSENFMIQVLGKVYEHLDPQRESAENREGEKNARLELFQFMGNMTDKEFDSFLQVLHNDTFEQWVVKVWRSAVMLGGSALETAEKAVRAILAKIENWIPEPDQVRDAIRAADDVAVGALDNFNAWLDRKGVPR